MAGYTCEVEAESVAYTVCQHFGLDTSDYSFGYVAGWSSGKEMTELKASLETIQTTAKELITEIEGHFTELQQQRQAEQEQGDTFSIYQLKRGDETRDLRFEPYDRLQAAGLTIDRVNYELVYTAPLTKDMTLGDIWERFNIDHPADFKGHSLSVSDIVVLHQNDEDTAHYVDSIGFQQVPEFLQEQQTPVFDKLPPEQQQALSDTVQDTLQMLVDADKRIYGDVTGKTLEAIAAQGYSYKDGQLEKQQPEATPDSLLTGETVRTPRGNFHITDMSREQIEAAGFGFHHASEDGKYLIMGNGTQAYAIAAEQPQRDNPLKHVEDTICLYRSYRPAARQAAAARWISPHCCSGRKIDLPNKPKPGANPYKWTNETVSRMLEKIEYLGHTVNFKTRKQSYKSKKKLWNDPSEWVIFENTQPPIVEESVFLIVQNIRKSRRRPTKMGDMGIFSGLLYCAECGGKMYQCRATNFTEEQKYFICSTYRKGKDLCTTHSIKNVVLYEIVLKNLREAIDYVTEYEAEFVQEAADSRLRERDAEFSRKRETLSKAENRIAELDNLFKHLYEDNVTGKLSDERFIKMSHDYELEQSNLKAMAEVLREEIKQQEKQKTNVKAFISAVKKYTDMQQLDAAMLREFIDRIEVSHTDKKSKTREITIVYNFIGAFDFERAKEKAQNTTEKQQRTA